MFTHSMIFLLQSLVIVNCSRSSVVFIIIIIDLIDLIYLSIYPSTHIHTHTHTHTQTHTQIYIYIYLQEKNKIRSY